MDRPRRRQGTVGISNLLQLLRAMASLDLTRKQRMRRTTSSKAGNSGPSFSYFLSLALSLSLHIFFTLLRLGAGCSKG
jgi:predicted ATPase